MLPRLCAKDDSCGSHDGGKRSRGLLDGTSVTAITNVGNVGREVSEAGSGGRGGASASGTACRANGAAVQSTTVDGSIGITGTELAGLVTSVGAAAVSAHGFGGRATAASRESTAVVRAALV